MGWRAHNPWDLAENLGHTRLWIGNGNGFNGTYETSGSLPYDPVEGQVNEMTRSFVHRLQKLGIPHTYAYYGGGTHSWKYWQRDLQQTLPGMLDTFAADPGPPSKVDLTAAEKQYSVYGWDVSIARDAPLAFTELSGADAHGFTLTGFGDIAVTTPADYTPSSAHSVKITAAGATTTWPVGADRSGRLRIALPFAGLPTSKATVEISP
jgi:hypothetical protein